MQFVHSVTGDRDAEAKSLNARTSDTSTVEDARRAVARAYGETGDEPAQHEHIASVGDAERVHDQRDAADASDRAAEPD